MSPLFSSTNQYVPKLKQTLKNEDIQRHTDSQQQWQKFYFDHSFSGTPYKVGDLL